MKKKHGGDAAIQVNLEPMAFEKEQLPALREMARSFARRAAGFGKRLDADEIASAALPILFNRYSTCAKQFWRRSPDKAMTIRRSRHSRRCAQAVRTSALGGDIGTDTPLVPDLCALRRGYRNLKPKHAESYSDRYNLPPCDGKPDGIAVADLQSAKSPLAKALLTLAADATVWKWITARANGASHIEAARTCGKHGSDKACESYSMRLAAEIRRRAAAEGLNAHFCEDGSGRTFATQLKTAAPAGDDDWLDAVISGKINLRRGI